MRMTEKIKIFYKSFQVILSEQMDSENQQAIYCEDGKYRLHCEIWDKLCIEWYYKNNLKSQTHINNIHKRLQLDKSFQVISSV